MHAVPGSMPQTLSFLCHQRIFNLSSPVLKSIQDGYLFFSEWYDELTDKG